MSRGNYAITMGVGVLAIAAVLSGCASNPAPASTPTPTETASPNAAACEDFASATSDMAAALSGENINVKWETVRADMDAAALSASGDVKERLQQLVDDWPEPASIMVYHNTDEINQMLDDIGRACEADGSEVAFHKFT